MSVVVGIGNIRLPKSFPFFFLSEWDGSHSHIRSLRAPLDGEVRKEKKGGSCPLMMRKEKRGE